MNNDMFQKQNKRIFAASMCAVFLVIAAVSCMIFRIFVYEDAYVINHAELNETQVRETSQKLIQLITYELEESASPERAERQAVSEVLLPLVEGNQRFYIFASEEKLLFYQNEQLTANRENYTLDRLLEQFRINGGEGFEAFSVMLQTGGTGTARFSLSENSGDYIGLAHTFEIADTEYICIYCISENYLLNIANARQQNILMTVVFLLFGGFLIAAIVFFVCCYLKMNKVINENDMEIERKNYIIDQFGQKVYHIGGYNEPAQIKCKETGIYTEEFLYNVITELQLKQEKPMLVIIFGFRGDKLYKEKKTDVFQCVKLHLGEGKLLFRLRQEQLVLLIPYDEDGRILEELQLLNYILQEKFKDIHLVVNSVYAVQKDGDSLYKVLEQVIKEYQKNFKTVR